MLTYLGARGLGVWIFQAFPSKNVGVGAHTQTYCAYVENG